MGGMNGRAAWASKRTPSFMRGRCTLRLPGVTETDDYGGQTTVPPQDTPNVPCWINPTRGDELDLAVRLGISNAWTVVFPAGTPVTQDHQVLFEGRTLNVKYIAHPKSDEVLLRVLCSEMRNTTSSDEDTEATP